MCGELLVVAKSLDCAKIKRMARRTKKVVSRLALILVIIGIGLSVLWWGKYQYGWWAKPEWQQQQQYAKTVADRTKARLKVGDDVLSVEVVNTPESMAQGLSGRREIGSHGMLFVQPERKKAAFWMKEMLFSIDIVWIADGKVVDISPEVPFPNPTTPLAKLPVYFPNQPIDWVLELPRGNSGQRQIVIGDTVMFLDSEK